MGKNVTKDDQIQALAEYMMDHVLHKPERRKFYAPPEQSVLYRMFRQGKLTKSQCIAANMIFMDALNAAGTSGGVVGGYEERVDTSRVGRTYDVRALQNAHQQRLQHVFESLHKHERPTFFIIIKEFDRSSKIKIDVRALGLNLSGPKNGAQANAAGTAIIQGVLNSCAEAYNVNDDDYEIGW